MVQLNEQSLRKMDPKLKIFLRLPRVFGPEDEEFLAAELLNILGEMQTKFSPNIKNGYCFIYFQTRIEAAQGHDLLKGKVVRDYALDPAFGYTEQERMAIQSGIKQTEIEQNHRTLYVKALPPGITDEMLITHFKPFGDVIKCNIIETKKGMCGFVCFRKFLPAHKALAAFEDGLDLDGTTVTVELSQNKNLRHRMARLQKNKWFEAYGFVNARRRPRLSTGLVNTLISQTGQEVNIVQQPTFLDDWSAASLRFNLMLWKSKKSASTTGFQQIQPTTFQNVSQQPSFQNTLQPTSFARTFIPY